MRSSSSVLAVSRITGISLVARSQRASDSPSSPGIMMSSSTRSIAWTATISRATAAVSALVTRTPFLPRNAASGSRMSRSSSTSNRCGWSVTIRLVAQTLRQSEGPGASRSGASLCLVDRIGQDRRDYAGGDADQQRIIARLDPAIAARRIVQVIMRRARNNPVIAGVTAVETVAAIPAAILVLVAIVATLVVAAIIVATIVMTAIVVALLV